MVALNFNAQQVAPNAALEPLPSGVYDIMITGSEEKPTKDGQGSYIQFEMTVQGGQFNGRKLFERLNTKNKSAQAVEIAFGTLSAICHVTGRYQIQDTQQLHGATCKAVVSKQPRDDKPDQMTNEIKGYKDAQGNDPGQAGAGGGGQPQGGGGQPQWAGGGGAQPPQQGQPQYGQQQWGQPQGQPQPNQGGQPQWAGNPAQGQPNGPAPHQGANGQQYPDPAHQPQQNNGGGYGNNGQPAPGAQPNGGMPQWAANNQGGQQPQQGQQPDPNQGQQQPQGQQGFQPGPNAPWANAGGQPSA